MSLFGYSPPLEEKPVNVHPWAKRIKDKHANKIKYAHNSIHNPKYPKEEDLKKVKPEPKKEDSESRLNFVIIGIRTSEQFIYCCRLVQGLYKYRCRVFAAPVIRAVTTVDWPQVLNDIKLQYGGIAFCLNTTCVVIMNGNLLGGIDELKEFILSKYSYNLCLDLYKESIKEFVKFVNSTSRSFVYMHFEIDSTHIGTMIFMLYTDIVPNTCENFMRLCTTSRGGYRGTPVHRIVKDCWIQCGGYGLKDNGMHCENFIVPFDRRGVLGMANAERHVNCSTQFFVILQPAQWMSQHYVGFGQLVDGNDTLTVIENTPVYYESPTRHVKIYASGILNLQCHDIMINKHAREYIYAHIENVYEVGNIYWKELWDRVAARIDELQEEQEEEEEDESKIVTDISAKRKKGPQPSVDSVNRSAVFEENNDFDVDTYHYEPEECSYQHVTSAVFSDKVTQNEKLFYMPLTDVPYPGECESTFDLKKFLRGDYCLGSDLQEDAPKEVIRKYPPHLLAEMMSRDDEHSEENVSDSYIDSDDEKEISKFFKDRAETISFAGKNIKSIAKASVNMFKGIQKLGLMSRKDVAKFKISAVITDEELRKNRHVSLAVSPHHVDKIVKRRQTGFAREINVGKLLRDSDDGDESDDHDDLFDEDDEPYLIKKMQAKQAAANVANKKAASSKQKHEHTRTSNTNEEEGTRKVSTLKRLYDEVKIDEKEPPTLKSYRPILETNTQQFFITKTKQYFDDELTLKEDKALGYRASKESYDILAPRSPSRKKLETKISFDYINTMENPNRRSSKAENSIRSTEFAKTRPTLSVSEYQTKIRNEDRLGIIVYAGEKMYPRII